MDATRAKQIEFLTHVRSLPAAVQAQLYQASLDRMSVSQRTLEQAAQDLRAA